MTLRSDNADLRLTEKGRAAGVVSDARWARFEQTRVEFSRATEMLQQCVLSPQVRDVGRCSQPVPAMRSAHELLAEVAGSRVL